MNEIKKANGSTEITNEDKILNAHQYLKEFLNKFEQAKRGGVHDFMELSIFNMIQTAISNIDVYLKSGHRQVVGNEVLAIVVDSYQKVLDGIKRNLENMEKVGMR